jgi:hypothetical protein
MRPPFMDAVNVTLRRIRQIAPSQIPRLIHTINNERDYTAEDGEKRDEDQQRPQAELMPAASLLGCRSAGINYRHGPLLGYRKANDRIAEGAEEGKLKH